MTSHAGPAQGSPARVAVTMMVRGFKWISLERLKLLERAAQGVKVPRRAIANGSLGLAEPAERPEHSCQSQLPPETRWGSRTPSRAMVLRFAFFHNVGGPVPIGQRREIDFPGADRGGLPIDRVDAVSEIGRAHV